MDQSKVWAHGPHFVDPESKSKEMVAVAPGMRFRNPDGTVVIVPMPKTEPPKPKVG